MPAVGSRSSAADASEAARISAAIDEELKQERAVRTRRKPREVKVMLLGQAESGKSTLQKQFQLYYASQSLDHERPSWRPIVYFNVLKALRMILDEIDIQYPQALNQPSSSGSSSYSPVSTANSTAGVFSFITPSNSQPSGSKLKSKNSQSPPSVMKCPDPNWFPELSYLRSKILPLVASEEALASELSGGITLSGGRTGVYVRTGWQALVTGTRSWPIAGSGSGGMGNVPRATAVTNIVAKTLQATKDEIYGLWRHPAVLRLLQDGNLRLEESASFFLEDIHRISEPDYLPVMDDILHVRLQTLGVTEHSFDITVGGSQLHWLMYDVGGARGQRHAWVPYFEDARAIIFLAPISAFDQYLEEDPRTNRIDDSLQLFTQVVSNRLLSNAALVLMLNKTDLLRRKLQAGAKVRKYISSYGDRPNNFEEVSEYFRAHFIQVQKRKDVAQRTLYVHFTSMLDIKATQRIIVNVGESILRLHLAGIGLA